MELLLVLVAVVVLALWALSRPHTVVRLTPDGAELVRGEPPPGLVGALRDVSRMDPSAAGKVMIRGGGHNLSLTVRGLDERTAQRVRNVVMMYRSRIR